MSTSYVLSLSAAVALILGSRLLLPAFPLRRFAAPMTVTDAVLAGAGMVGLVVHCGAMFFRSLVETLPGSATLIRQINELGTASMLLYAVPAVLVLLALRRQHRVALAVVMLALAGVAVTMYDGGSLEAHLTAIFIAVVIMAGVSAMLVRPPRLPRSD